jgi:hypothetical protein
MSVLSKHAAAGLVTVIALVYSTYYSLLSSSVEETILPGIHLVKTAVF